MQQPETIINVAVGLVGSLAGVAVAWGTFRQRLCDQADRVVKLETKMQTVETQQTADRVNMTRLQTLVEIKLETITKRLDEIAAVLAGLNIEK